jgi:yecA family protein
MTEIHPHLEIQKALVKINSEADASEAHGMLCGMICATGKGDINMWMSQILGDQDPRDISVRQAQQMLMDLHDRTVQQITDGNYGLRLLLSADDIDMDHRIDELGDWCQGFLFGLTLSGVSDFEALPDETREIINDIIDISKAGYDAGEDEEENENAYTEIVEYIRIGVLVIFNELNGPPENLKEKVLH